MTSRTDQSPNDRDEPTRCERKILQGFGVTKEDWRMAQTGERKPAVRKRKATKRVGSGTMVGARLAAEVADRETFGCTRCDRMLGIQKMPEGYALMLNPDETHFYWLRHDGGESSIDWNKWRVRRGAIANANKQTESPNMKVSEPGT